LEALSGNRNNLSPARCDGPTRYEAAFGRTQTFSLYFRTSRRTGYPKIASNWLILAEIIRAPRKRGGVAIGFATSLREDAMIAPFLEDQPIFRSVDLDEAIAFFRQKGFRLHVTPRQVHALDVRVHCACLPGLYIGRLQYGAPVVAEPESPGTDYFVTFPLAGRVGASMAGQSIRCDLRNAALLSYPPAPPDPIRSEEGCVRFNLTLVGSAVANQLGALLGVACKERPSFAPQLNIGEGYGSRLMSYLRLAISDFDTARAILWSPLTIAQFEQFIITGLLLAHPHSYSEALHRLERSIIPRDIKRALDYIHDHLDEPIRLADLVRSSDVPGRTLLKHFRDYKGTSPMRYVRDARLDRVREALLRADAEDCVTTIALKWGFSHMGRFSLAYRTRFGESPSRTLLRHR
jgi:AraC-like DNA-binding protein